MVVLMLNDKTGLLGGGCVDVEYWTGSDLNPSL